MYTLSMSRKSNLVFSTIKQKHEHILPFPSVQFSLNKNEGKPENVEAGGKRGRLSKLLEKKS